MSGKQQGKVWDLDLKAPQQLVLLALADSAEHDGTSCFPSLGLVAWKTGYSVRNVRRVLRDLEEADLIEPKGSIGGRGHTTLYHLHIDRGPKKPPYESARKADKMAEQDQKANPDNLSLKADTALSANPSGTEPSEPCDGSSSTATSLDRFHAELAAQTDHAAPGLAERLLDDLVASEDDGQLRVAVGDRVAGSSFCRDLIRAAAWSVGISEVEIVNRDKEAA